MDKENRLIIFESKKIRRVWHEDEWFYSVVDIVSVLTDSNLWRMKQFYDTYKGNKKLTPLVTEISWTNNLIILSSSKTDEEREFYLLLTSKERYSKRELERQIKSSIFERTMLANEKLSPVVRELPQETKDVFRDSYALEFLNLPTPHSEKDLQLNSRV